MEGLWAGFRHSMPLRLALLAVLTFLLIIVAAGALGISSAAWSAVEREPAGSYQAVGSWIQADGPRSPVDHPDNAKPLPEGVSASDWSGIQRYFG